VAAQPQATYLVPSRHRYPQGVTPIVEAGLVAVAVTALPGASAGEYLQRTIGGQWVSNREGEPLCQEEETSYWRTVWL
jgi:hypothetical protein